MLIKEKTFFEVLEKYASIPIKVTEIRDHLLRICKVERLNPAAERRWVNGKCVSLVNKGLLVKTTDEASNKSYFQVTSSFSKFYSSNGIERKVTQSITNQNPPYQEISGLKKDLENCRQKALVQLGEITEYKRIRDRYPKFCDTASEKFKEMVNMNHRLLGQIRALETVLDIHQ